jgi:capsid assembly protease
MLLPHLASRLYGSPLLLARSKLEVILSVLGDRVGWPQTQASVALPTSRSSVQGPAGIAVIPVMGSLVRRTVGLDPASGFTSYAELAGMLETALADPSVEGILLDVDSPGGEAGGVFELGEMVRAADAVKPVWAIASDSAYSAAYAIACGASRLTVTRTGGVGSIGVIAMHVDQSARDAQQGYRFTAITAGEQKNDFTPHAPLDIQAHARLQTEVDRLYGMFVGHVASMRGIDTQAVRATEAGVYFAQDAVDAGLADAVGSLDGVIADFSAFLSTRRARVRSPPSSTHSMVSADPVTLSNHSHAEKFQMQNTPNPAAPLSPSDADPSEQKQVDPVATDTNDADNQQAAVDTAVAATRADALAIVEMCQLAGHSDRAATYLSQGTTVAQVRRALLDARAQSTEITSLINPDAKPAQARDENNPLLQAVKKLTAK